MNPDLLTELESIAYAQVDAWNAWRQHCAEHGIAIDSEPEGNEILALAAKSAIAALPAALESLAMARRAILAMPEWTRGMYGMQNCLWCGGEEYDGEPYQDPPDDAYPVWHGHAPDCQRQAALKWMEP